MVRSPLEIGKAISMGMPDLDRAQSILDQALVEARRNRLLISLMTPAPFGSDQELAEAPGQRMIDRLEQVGPSDDLRQTAGAERGQVPADLLGQQPEQGDDVVGGPLNLARRSSCLGGDSHRAGVQMALAHHLATEGEQRKRPEPEALGTEQGGDHHIPTGPQPAVGLQGHMAAETVGDQHLVGFGETELPGGPGVFDGFEWRGAGPALHAGDKDGVGLSLGHSHRDRADSRLGDQLDGDTSRR